LKTQIWQNLTATFDNLANAKDFV